jgi:tRNA-dihydrouridine synthase
MLGRGILVNPFLPAQIKGLADPVGDKMERIQKFHDAYVTRLSHELSGPAHIVDKLKGFWTYTHFLFEQGPAFFKKMIKTKHYEAYSALVEQFFSQKPVVLENVHIKSDDFQ